MLQLIKEVREVAGCNLMIAKEAVEEATGWDDVRLLRALDIARRKLSDLGCGIPAMSTPSLSLTRHDLGQDCWFQAGRLPGHLIWGEVAFEEAWALRPAEKPIISVRSWTGPAPRYMRAFNRDYKFSRQISEADPVPELLQPLLSYVQCNIDHRLNGILVNSYEPTDYIGGHRDKATQLVEDSVIVTVSFGEQREFVLERKDKKVVVESRTFPTPNGSVFVMPLLTNKLWYHGVPRKNIYTGRRISVTFRAFE